jgi:hypothetical protein
MVVGDQNVVDPVHVGQAGGRYDPVGIATVKVRPTCVDQQGLPRRRHNQRSLPTFNVNEIDVQVLGDRRGRDEAAYKENISYDTHGGNPITSPSTPTGFWNPICC